MPGKINKGDIFDDSFFKALTDADKELKSLLITFQALAKEAREISKGVSAAKTFDDLSKTAAKAGKSIKDLTAEEKKLVQAKKNLDLATSETGKKIAKLNEESRRARAENKKLAQSQLGVAKSTNTWGKAITSFQFKFNALGNIAANVVSRIARGIGRAIRSNVKSIVEFDQALADVGAIAEATEKQLDRLRRTALELGGSTKFTATEVLGLQKELAKLGYTTSEILAAQSAILDLAAAAQTDLPNAAEIAGITVNQFGLQAKDTQRVVDVMAKSFTSSALDIGKFSEAMKFVGPAAKASGISVEQATARLAQLADAGISGSMAGTSLRQIMLALSKESGTFSEKIQRAADSGLDLAGATEEVQKRAATALLVLADGVGDVDALTTAFENAGGAAEELAEKQLDTLKGKITILGSAWNRFVLTVTESESKFRGLKSVLGGFADILNNYVDAANAADNLGTEEALSFFEKFMEEIEGSKASDQLKALGTELEFVKGEMNEYSQELSEANYQLANTKKREKEAIAEWERRKGVAEGMLRIYGEYLVMLRDINIEQEESNENLEQYADVSEQLKQLKKDEIKSFKEDDQDYVETHKEKLDIIQENYDDAIEYLEALNQQALENDLERLNVRTEAENLALEQRLAAEELLKDTKILMANEAFNFVSALYDRQLATIEAKERAGVITTEKAEEEKAKIRRKQAIIEKAQAIFNIIINTAIAVSKVMGQTGIISPFLIPAIIALGALQVATVLAQPIPTFEEGTDFAPGGVSIVGEKGKELMIGPDGKIGLTPDSATLMNINKGTKIIPADITNELMRYSAVATGMNGEKDDRVILAVMQKMDRSNERLYKAVKDKPVTSSILTPAGIRTLTFKGNTVVTKMDKYFK